MKTLKTMVVCEDIHIEDYDKRRHRMKTMESEDIGFGLSITSVILTLFTWTPLNSTVVPMTQQRRKGNNETTQSSRSIVFTQCPLMS